MSGATQQKPHLLACIIEQMVELYGAPAVVSQLGQYLSPEQRLEAALQWEIEAYFCERETIANARSHAGAKEVGVLNERTDKR